MPQRRYSITMGPTGVPIIRQFRLGSRAASASAMSGASVASLLPSADYTHGTAISTLPDSAGGEDWTSSGGSLSPRVDWARLNTSTSTARLNRDTLAISGRTAWRYRHHWDAPSGYSHVRYYSEAASESDRLSLDWDLLGRPRVVVRRPGESAAVATCSGSIAPRWTPSNVGSSTRVYNDSAGDDAALADSANEYHRRTYTIAGHTLRAGRMVHISGHGREDGTWTVTDTQGDVVTIVKTNPDLTNATNGGGRQLPPTTNDDIVGCLCLPLDDPRGNGESWAVSLWVNHDATGADSHSGGAGILCGGMIRDFSTDPPKFQIRHDGGGSPGSYVAEVAGLGLTQTLGAATADTYRHLAASYDSTTGLLTCSYDGTSLRPFGLHASSDARLIPSSGRVAIAVEVTFDGLGADQDIVVGPGRLYYDQSADAITYTASDGTPGGGTTGLTTPPANTSFELGTINIVGSQVVGSAAINAGTGTTGGPLQGWTASGGTSEVIWLLNFGGFGGTRLMSDAQNSAAPAGTQRILLDGAGSISQAFTVGTRAYYDITLDHLKRTFNVAGNSHTVGVDVDGVEVGTAESTTGDWQSTTIRVLLEPGEHTLRVRAGAGTGQTILDRVTVTRSAPVEVAVTPSGGTQTATAYRLVAWHDPVNDEIGLDVEGETPATASWDLGLADYADGQFYTGEADISTVALDGSTDDLAVFSPASVADEIATIISTYQNGGSGVAYGDLSTAFKADSGLVAWYDADGDGRAWEDAHTDGIDLKPDLSGIEFTGIGLGYKADHSGRLGCVVSCLNVWFGRALSSADRTALYNSGDALTYSGLSAGLQAGIWGAFDTSEKGGDAVDASGNGNHLINPITSFPGAAGAQASPPAWAATTGTVTVRDLGLYRTYATHANGHETERQYERHCLDVVRDGTAIRWYHNGTELGTATLDIAATGPTSGTASILSPGDRHRGLRGSLFESEAIGSAPSTADALQSNKAACLLVERPRGVGPLPTRVSAEAFAPLHPDELQDAWITWQAVNRSTDEPSTDATYPSGQSRAVQTGPLAAFVFDEVGVHDIYCTIVRPPYDRTGSAQSPSILFHGLARSVVVEDWPSTTKDYYVDVDAGSSGDGLSESSPFSTFAEAAALATAFTRIHVKRGTVIDSELPSLANKSGPIEVLPYGTGAAPYVLGDDEIGLQGTSDVRWRGVNYKFATATPPWATATWWSCFQINGSAGLFVDMDMVASEPDINGDRTYGKLWSDLGAASCFTAHNCKLMADIYCAIGIGHSDHAYLGCTFDGEYRGTAAPGLSLQLHLFRLTGGLRNLWAGWSNSDTWDGNSDLPTGNGTTATSFPIPNFTSNRYGSHLTTVVDSDISYSIGIDGSPDFTSPAHVESTGVQRVLVERVAAPRVSINGCDNVTVRDLSLGLDGDMDDLSNQDNLQFQAQRHTRQRHQYNIRYYNSRKPDSHEVKLTPNVNIIGDPDTVPLVAGTFAAMEAATDLAPAGIDATATASGVAVLVADGAPEGATDEWAMHRWVANGVEVPGQRGSVCVYRGSGSVEFRLDVVDVQTGTVVQGSTTTTVVIP